MNTRQKKKNKPYIIHVKIPISDSGCPILSCDTINNYVKYVSEAMVGSGYKFIASPFEMFCLDSNKKILTIDCQQYSYNELQEMIKKARK